MKIKVSELNPPLLDAMVLIADGEKLVSSKKKYEVTDNTWLLYSDSIGRKSGFEEFSPSSYWDQGGPIIGREKISIWETCTERNHPAWSAITRIRTWMDPDDNIREESFGDTPLIAAMRCYVALKLGDTVEIPDELWDE